MRWTWLLIWLVAPTVIAVLSAHPEIAVVAVVAFVARRFLPDPVVWLRTFGRVRRLETTVELNPENVTARRDLATLQLERGRAGSAAQNLAEALTREPSSAELHFLLGAAKLRGGDAASALASLDRAIQIDERLRYGDAFLRKGDAHRALGAVDDTVSAYEKFLRINGSSLEGYVKLARAKRAKGDGDGARAALAEGRRTFRHLPSFKRKKELGWYAAALVLSAVP